MNSPASTSTRERLIATSGEMFYEHGFQAVGLDRIIDAVGISKTAFYKHFESKDELIVAVLMERDQREMVEWMNYVRIRGRDDARAQLAAFFELLDEWFSRPGFNGCLFLNALTEFPNENDPINRAARTHGEHLGAAIRELCRIAGARDLEGLTAQLLLLMTGAISARHRETDLQAGRRALDMARVLVAQACGDAGQTAPAAAPR